MKKLSLLFVSVLLFSCSDILEHVIENTIDNAIPDPEALQIGVKNNSNVVFTSIEIISQSGLSLIFQETQPGYYSEFRTSDYAFSQTEIAVQTVTGYYFFIPISFSDETRVTKGKYYYDISILNSDTLLVTRKPF